MVDPNTLRLQGTPVNSEQVRVEGMDSTYSLGMSTYSFAQPSVDSIEEVAVQTSNFAAELGLAGGAAFNITMKSGTDQLHGSVYDYFINEALKLGSLSVRAEFTNIFNRTRFPNPTATNALATQSTNALGLATAGFGYMNTTNLAGVGGPRAGQIVGRFRF